MDYQAVANTLGKLLGLERQAVAVCFMSEAPQGIARVQSPAPASCSYWKLASEGQVFYTTAEDQLNCPIGAYTHGVPLPSAKATELQATLGQMVEHGYLGQEEIPQVPRRQTAFQVAVYAPLGQSPYDPDVVIVRGNPMSAMLLTEAAVAAGVGPQMGIMARPTCAFIPYTLERGRTISSFGCIGNRIYTGLTDTELYFTVPGARVAAVAAQLEKIAIANEIFKRHHQARCAC